MTDPRRDEELEAFLQRRSLARPAGLEPLEPPPELDHLVLAQAREALEAESEAETLASPYRGVRGAMPFALTATFVLTIAVVLVLRATHGPTVVAAGVPPPPSVVREPAPPPRAAAPAPSADRPSAPAAQAFAAGKAAPPRDATQWLAEIRALRAAGRVKEADAEWAAYTAAHPPPATRPP